MKNEMPKIPNSNHKLLKKGTKLVLSAATFGVVAAGSFQGVNCVFDNYNKQNTTVQSTNVVKTSSSTTSNVSAVAQNCMPSIVSITNVSVSDVQNYFSMYGNNSRSNPFTQQESTSVGSGVIINKKNGEIDILTNYHVIENAKTLTCTLADNTNVEATVKGVDEDRDLAVISIKTKDLSEDTLKQIAIATIGDSDKLQVGEQVVAIGNALGYGQSVTTGIVSATNRSVSTSSDTDKSQSYIQTDAAINPGNSGGALLNMSGELIGINSAKLSDTDVEGMGYAIAISDVKDSINTMLEGKDVSKSSTQSSYYSQYNNNEDDDSSSPFDFGTKTKRLFKSIIKQSFYIFKPRSYNLLSCFFEKPWYIEGDEGVHCGTQSGGIRPSSFFIYLKRSKLLVL